MDELLDMIVADESPSKISDRITDMLFAKTAESVDAYKPDAAASLFGQNDSEEESETEAETAVAAEVGDE